MGFGVLGLWFRARFLYVAHAALATLRFSPRAYFQTLDSRAIGIFCNMKTNYLGACPSILEFALRLFPQMWGQQKTLTPEPLNPKLRAVAQRMQGLNGLLSFSCAAGYVFSIHSDRKDTGNFSTVPLYFYCTTSTRYIGVT